MIKANSRKWPLGGSALLWHALGAGVLLAAIVFTGGCTTMGDRGERLQFGPADPHAPRTAQILASLALNDAAVENFRAVGSFTLESPEFDATRVFREGAIRFRRPADLSVSGRNAIGMEIFRMTSVGSEFLIDFPASRDKPYYRVEGERFASVPFSVSPSDIAREMFLPEDWNLLRQDETRLLDYDESGGTAVLEIGPRGAPRRRITVMGPPWVVVKNERIEAGQVVAVTVKRDYREVNGVNFPAFIDAHFPGEHTRMTFEMRRVLTNVDLNTSLFDLKSRARAVGVYIQ